MTNQKLDCEIVRDLLPLYHDNVVSEMTKKLVEQHLERCDTCRKEFEILCMDLPIEANEVSTKTKFSNMMKKSKRKRNFTCVIAVALSCVLLLGGYFLQLQIPIVNIKGENITVHSAYRYKTDEGYKLFVLYSYSSLNHTKGDISVGGSEEETILEMNIKKPLLSQNVEEIGQREEVWRYEYGYCSGDNGERQYYNFDKVTLGGTTIWSEAKNAEDEIPEYVYAYEDFEESKGNVVSWITDIEKGYVGANYYDGRFVTWDLNGNVLYEGYSIEN